jgi:hypothetical protein
MNNLFFKRVAKISVMHFSPNISSVFLKLFYCKELTSCEAGRKDKREMFATKSF